MTTVRFLGAQALGVGTAVELNSTDSNPERVNCSFGTSRETARPCVTARRDFRWWRALRTVLAFLMILPLFPSCGVAQMQQGTITGSVVDTTGAVIPNATIAATNTATGAVNRTVSNADGYFTIPYLTPGVYDLAADAQGFQQTKVAGIHLTINLSTTVTFTMKPGKVTQQITVQASPIQLETVNSELGGTVSPEQISELPQLGRNPYNLLELEPGAIQENKAYNGINLSINGGLANTTNILLDGGTQVNTSTGDPGFTPPLDSIGEVKLITYNFSAVYGMSGSGILTISTKYGTNEFHGSAYDYVRNTLFNANGWYPNHVDQTRSPYHENHFGFTIGGPAWFPKLYNGHNKTFFFMNLDWDPESVPDLITQTVPTAAMRTGDFSGLVDASGKPIIIYDPNTTVPVAGKSGTYTRSPFPNNIIPAYRLNQVALNLLQYYPLPNAPGTEGIYNNYQDNAARTTKQDTLLVRIDQNFGAKNKAFVMVGRHAAVASNPLINIAFPQAGTNGTPGTHSNLQWTGVLSDEWTIRPNLLAEFQANFIHGYAWNNVISQGFNSSTLGLPQSFAQQVEDPVFPQFATSNVSPLGIANSAVDNNTEGGNQGQAHLTWVTHAHTIEAGLDYRFAFFNNFEPTAPAGVFTFSRGYTQGPNPASASTDAGWDFASELLGILSSGDITQDAAVAFSQKNIDAYISDDYKLTRKLTLNVGVRYDGLTGMTDRHNRITWFDPQKQDPITQTPGVVEFAGLNGNPRGQTPTSNNFGPRLGFAYRLGGETSIRGGGGLFAMTNTDAYVNWSGYKVQTSMYLGPSAAVPNTPPAGGTISNPYTAGFLPYPGTASTLVGTSISEPFRKGTIPLIYDYNLSVQRAITPGTILTAAYAGSRGEHLWWNKPWEVDPIADLSLGPQLTTLVPNPYAGHMPGTLGAKTVKYEQLLLPFPQYTGLTYYHDPVGDSYYNSSEMELMHRDTHGLFFQVSYTLSKSIDDVPERYNGRSDTFVNPNDLGLTRGLAEYDRTQYAVVNYVYQLPFGPGRQLAKRGIASDLLGNWELSGITTYGSGEPVVITGANSTNLIGISALADRLHDPHLKHQTPEEWFDTTAYADAAPYTTGTGNRIEPDLRGPAYGNWDLGLTRQQQIHENMNLH